MATTMPVITLDAADLDTGERQLAELILGRGGKLRASKPTIRREADGSPVEPSGSAAYLWRMVAFQVSPRRQHQCMPVMAFCDLPRMADRGARRAREKELNALADQIAATVPCNQHHGTRRWAQAFGMTGTPQVVVDGAVVYR